MNGWDRYRVAELAVYVRKARNGDDPDDLRAVRPLVQLGFIAIFVAGLICFFA